MPEKIGRNTLCPCGSGKKYKNCCLKQESIGGKAAQDLSIPDAAGHPESIAKKAIKVLILAVFVLLLYSNTFKSPFVLDDAPNITENTHIRLSKLTFKGLKEAGLKSPSSSRPAANISFALNYYLDEYNVTGYHIVNILIHITAGVFLYLLVRRTMGLPCMRKKYGSNEWVPFVAALIWLVHPVQTQSVTYIVQRMTSMAVMFYVMSLYLYVIARLTDDIKKKWILFGGCILAGILAVSTKEIAATLPFFILVYEWFFFQDLDIPWLKRRVLPVGGVLVLLAVLALIFLSVHPVDRIMSTYETRDFTMGQRVLTQFRVMIYYVSLLLFPHPSRLCLDRYYSLSTSLISPFSTLICGAAIAGCLALAVFVAKRERMLSFAILWFFGNLAIESSFVGLEMIFEHRIYLPSMFLISAAVLYGYRYIKPKWLRIGITGVIILLCSIWSFQRNSVWQVEEELWKDCVAKSPLKARPYYNLGVIILEKERHEEAEELFKKAISLKHDYPKAHNNLGNAYEKMGMIEKAMEHYKESLRLSPDNAEAVYNMGYALEKKGDLEEALTYFSKAIELKPDYKDAYNNFGNVLGKQKKNEEALVKYLKALEIDPEFVEVHNNIGAAYGRMNMYDKAISHYLEAIRIKPDYLNAYSNLGVAYSRQGMIDEAVKYYNMALDIKPDFKEGRSNLGFALLKAGRLQEAEKRFRECVRVDPGFAQSYHNLGVALLRQKKYDEAEKQFQKAIEMKPDYAKAYCNMGISFEEQGELDKALKEYAEAGRIKPDYVMPIYKSGSIYMAQGRPDKARELLSRAIEIDPDHKEAHFSLGVVFLLNGNEWEGAVSHFTRALEIDPALPEAHSNLGFALTQLGRRDEAKGHFIEAVRLRPDFADAHNNLGIIYEREGDIEKALYHYSEAVRIDSGHKDAQKNLERIQKHDARIDRKGGKE